MPPQTPPRWRAFRLSKRGHAAEDYEDAYAGDPAGGRFAVADGATEASFAAAWARMLAEGFVTAPGRPWQDLSWVDPLRRLWAAQIDQSPLPWYAEAKREQGAFATLLALTLETDPGEDGGQWRALAVGDSCLFQLRDGAPVTSFPLTESAQFGNQPALLGSRDRSGQGPPAPCAFTDGRWRPGDRFLLMTDALARWFLEQYEAGRKPLEAVERLLAEPSPDEAFPGWVEARRRREDLRNDDVTLLVIDPGP
jgi:hypothetical protein